MYGCVCTDGSTFDFKSLYGNDLRLVICWLRWLWKVRGKGMRERLRGCRDWDVGRVAGEWRGVRCGVVGGEWRGGLRGEGLREARVSGEGWDRSWGNGGGL
jgi:hypothetical protein